MLVCWHQQALSWSHGSISTTAVLALVRRAKTHDGSLDLARLELQDTGILLACIAGTITNAAELSTNELLVSESTYHGHLWYMAAVACMRASSPDIRHLRIIQTLFLSAEILGLRDQQLALLDTVPRLRGSGYDEQFYDDTISRLTFGPLPQAIHEPIQQARQRFLWSQLCVQSWLATSALHLGTEHIHPGLDSEIDREAQRTYLASTAYVQPCFKALMHEQIVWMSQQDATSVGNYHALVQSDAQLRALTIEPSYASSLANQVAHSHIILLLHHKHFVESLKDAQYAFSHWASVEASKHIVASIEEGIRQNVLALWTFLCPLVTAAIALSNALACASKSTVDTVAQMTALNKAIILIRSSCYSVMLHES